MLRVTQEAVGNAARHADPARITVRLRGAAGQAVLEIADDGRGFDLAAPSPEAGAPSQKAGGLGLHTMRDRVTELGGVLTVDSAPGEGTTIRARFPVRAVAVRAGVTEDGAARDGAAGEGAAATGLAGEGAAVIGAAGDGVSRAGVTREAR
jgi:signal transduction histidine kinase